MTSLLKGHATAQGTAHYSRRFEEIGGNGHFRIAEDLTWSSLGLGTYLGRADAPTDRQVTASWVQSVRAGINVVDTAINYRSEHAEQSVGKALKEIVAQKVADRNELIVCTKGGFLPQSLGQAWFQETFVQGAKTGVRENDLVAECHCMHPAYLEDQLDRSRKNLGVETIDLYYLHNPEMQVGEVDGGVFYNRLESAFSFLERAAKEGKIRYYGLATWSAFRVGRGGRGMSLVRTCEAARRAAGGAESRLRFIQLPLNLQMLQAVRTPTQEVEGKMWPAIPAAGKLGLHCLTSGSIAQGDIPIQGPDLVRRFGPNLSTDAQRALQFTRSAPGVLTALVGMKQASHVRENLDLVRQPALSAETFEDLITKIK
ncbi:MAG: aldo/keto reductase [Nitrospinae bacterium CG11_big_fil_rev_8_21_14_0_20_56_8]|nr:MAG: aldo/keto reductase [Nitrospinae bacterium CG11_big_fil_rev_8_21_14_0_20_56_8]